MKINGNKEKALAVLKRRDSKLQSHLNSCVRCGLCAESCIFYLSTGEERYIPARKVDIVSSVYRRYNTLAGKLMPGLVKARELDEFTLTEMVDLLFGSCTMCGRCTAHCSIGVDISYLVSVGRSMLAEMAMVPSSLQSTVDAAIKTGNNMGIPVDELLDTLEWLEDDLRDEVDDTEAAIPVNKSNVNILYTLNPREPKFFPLSISAMAKIFYAAGESWTLSTRMYDVTNYAYYSGNLDEAREIARRLRDEMFELNARICVLAECGHGSRSFRWEGPNYLGSSYAFETITSVELISRYLKEGRIKLDSSLNTERITLHDPCNLVRSGGIFEEQRFILERAVSDFVEMNPYGYDNYCCGGGGGQLAMSEYGERRLKAGELKVKQIKNTGALTVVSPCHNCVDQLMQLNQVYRMNVKIKTLAEIVADALVLE
ncbi:MAG TPA: (Fe-S)-binding protein [Bacteroidetes bacterium]|nr:(Fe-S)-binding protein [Bacteroidota bacterium]